MASSLVKVFALYLVRPTHRDLKEEHEGSSMETPMKTL